MGYFYVNGLGNVMSFGYAGYNYIATNGSNATLDLQANGTNGVVQMDAKASAKLTVNGTVEINCQSSVPDCLIGAPVGLPEYTVAGLPACGTSLKDHIVAVTDASSPTYGGALSGGSGTHIIALCNGSAWTAH